MGNIHRTAASPDFNRLASAQRFCPGRTSGFNRPIQPLARQLDVEFNLDCRWIRGSF